MTPPVAHPGPPRIFDPGRRAAHLMRSRSWFAGADFLHRRAAENAVISLEAILREFPLAVDLSAHGGVFEPVLRASDAAESVGTVQDGLGSGSNDPDTALALEAGSVDLVVSLMSLHWANDLPGALAQIRRSLKPDGLFLGTLLGAATLKELRWALTEAELAERGGAQARVSPFADGYDAAALLQRAGFALPVADVDRVTVNYASLPALVGDLRAMGETNALAGPIRPLTRTILVKASALYAERFAGPDGRIPATFEIIQLAGWAPHESQQQPLARGSARQRLADAVGGKEIRAD